MQQKMLRLFAKKFVTNNNKNCYEHTIVMSYHFS